MAKSKKNANPGHDSNSETPLEQMRASERRFFEKRRQRLSLGKSLLSGHQKTSHELGDHVAIPDHLADTKIKTLTYDDGIEILFSCIKNRHLHQDWKYSFTDEQKTIVRQLIRYFIRDGSCKYDLKKGIYLWGDTGIGKSELMGLFKSFTQKIGIMRFEIVNCPKLVLDLANEKEVSILYNNFTGHKCFDDFGFEEQSSNVYGNNVRVMEMVINERDRYGVITHVTTNVPPKMLGEVYDKRTVSRCHKLFNFIEFQGKDHRKQEIES